MHRIEKYRFSCCFGWIKERNLELNGVYRERGWYCKRYYNSSLKIALSLSII